MTGVESRHRVAIAGRVVDARTQRPLAGAVVELATAPAALRRRIAMLPASRPDRTTSDAHGRFVFLDLPPGAYTLVARSTTAGSRYGLGKARTRVAPEPAVVELAVPPTAVEVTVTDGRAPVAHARVRLRGSGERAVTGADGRCVLTAVEPGQRTVVVEAAGVEPVTRPVEVKGPGTTAAVSVRVAPGS